MIHNDELFFSDNVFFEALFNNTVENTVIMMSDQGIIIAVNKAFTQCFGYQPEDIIGKYAAVLFTEEDRKKGLPEKELYSVLTRGQGNDNNYLVNKNNKVTWVSGESILVKNEDGKSFIIKLIQNIHKLKESELDLQSLNDFNENILGAIKDVVIVLDEKMNMVRINKAFTKLFMQDDVLPVSMNFADFVEPYDSFGELKSAIEQAILTKKNFSNFSIEIKISSGEKRAFGINSSPMHSMDGTNNLLLVIHDITIYKQLERSREDLIGFVAHELRNPLANLVLCNDLMGEFLRESKIDEAVRMLQRSKNNVLRLNKMIAELYNATKMNSGTLNLEISTFNFEDMIKEAIDTVTVLQPDYNVLIEGSGNIEVTGDKYRLIEVVTNYLSNGIKYSNGSTDVTLGIFYDEDSVTVSVKDAGLGIAAAELPLVFERYFRAEQSRNLEGLGLGLYLCRRIINAHNGKVWVESEEGKGSVFYFSIPR